MSFDKFFGYIIGISIFLNTILSIWINAFAPIDVQAFLDNPNFSPSSTPIYDHGLITSSIASLISNGIPIVGGNSILGLFGVDLAINPFSLFGIFPNNLIQNFISTNIAGLAFVPPVIAMPFLIITLASIFGIFWVLISGVITIIKGIIT